MKDGPSKIELTVCDECRFCDHVGWKRNHTEISVAGYGCTHPEVIAHTMPQYSYRVFGAKPEQWVQFVALEMVGRSPIPHGNCPFMEKTDV